MTNWSRNLTYYCPQQEGSCNGSWESDYFYTIPAWAGLISSLLSVIGCVLMLISYQQYRDFRTGSRKVATCLAVFNLFLALGYIVGSLNYMIYRYAHGSDVNSSTLCSGFSYICVVQAFVTWSSALASFIWTGILAVYLFVTLVKKTIHTANHSLTWLAYFVVSLVFPIVIMTVVVATGNLGYSPYASGGSCFITTGEYDKTTDIVEYRFTPTSLSVISVIKVLEVASYVIVVFFFAVIQYKIVALPSLDQVHVNINVIAYTCICIVE